jgi:YbbR domain-containing protein
MSKIYQTNFNFQMKFEVADGYVIKDLPKEPLSAVLTGKGWDLFLFNLLQKKITLQVPLNESRQVTRNYVLQLLKNYTAGSKVNFDDLNFDSLNLVLEKKVTKKIPVGNLPAFELAPGYIFKKLPELNPAVIEISGPASVVHNIEKWNFPKMEIPKLKSDISLKVPINQFQSGISVSPGESTLLIEIEELAEKSFFVPVKLIGELQNEYKIFPDKVHLTCAVGMSKYNDLEADFFSLEVHLDQSSINERTLLPIQLGELPYWIKQVKFSPENVRYFTVK